jgi:hypothetical protein
MSEAKMPVIVVSRKNETGEIVAYDEHSIWFYDDGDPDPFMFEEGNYSCDCNRGLFHDRAKGLEPGWDEHDCSHDKYDVDLYNADTLELVYREID